MILGVKMRLIFSGLAVGLCVACATEPAVRHEVMAEVARANATHSTGGVFLTDGHDDIRFSAAGTAQCGPLDARAQSAALASTNATRRAQGLAPLQADQRLQRAAEAHACDMAERGLMTHVGRRSSGPLARAQDAGYPPKITAENIAAGTFPLGRAVDEWAKSPDHRANVLLDQARRFGVAEALGSDGRTRFFVAVYAGY